MLQETDSDDGPTHENNFRLTDEEKAEVFNHIKEEMELIDEPRKERLQNCGQIYTHQYQQRK